MSKISNFFINLRNSIETNAFQCYEQFSNEVNLFRNFLKNSNLDRNELNKINERLLIIENTLKLKQFPENKSSKQEKDTEHLVDSNESDSWVKIER